MTVKVLRGQAGLFVQDGTTVGGFLGWRIEGLIHSLMINGHRRHYCSRKTYRLSDWWINDSGVKTALAVFCKIIKGRLIPLQEEEIAAGEYVPGARNAELILEKELSK